MENCQGDEVAIMKPDENHRERLNELILDFRGRFQREAQFVVRVPGRVNLIGEHVDYCGYSVCPMAIEQDVLVAVSRSEKDELQLTNVNPKYKEYRNEGFSSISKLCINGNSDKSPEWYKYFLCGVKGALEAIPKDRLSKGLLVDVSGNIPPNAGLSSSSALVSAALLSTIHASECKMSKEDMATISASAERYIGTQGGGMDQAIAFLAKSGTAKLIEFNPLRAVDVTLPKDAVFVIAHSLADHNKAATNDFNTRVVECRLAAQVIAKKRGYDWRSVQKLIDLQKCLKKSLSQMLAITTEDLPKDFYTIKEICEILETSPELLKSISGVIASQEIKLRQRAQHVFQEADRVIKFQNVNKRKDLSELEKLRSLGQLMSESHSSLKKLYQCSHPQVDELVSVAMKSGALGSRLTGAGWGGCVVSLTTTSKADEFVESLKRDFYQKRQQLRDVDLNYLIFKTEPKQGATIYHVE